MDGELSDAQEHSGPNLLGTMWRTVIYGTAHHITAHQQSLFSVGWGPLIEEEGGGVLALPPVPLSHTDTQPDCDGDEHLLYWQVYFFSFRAGNIIPQIQIYIYQYTQEPCRCLNLI